MGLFKITKYAGPHTCLMNEISVEHGNLGKSMIATHLLGMVRQDPAYDIKFVQQNVKDRFGFEISYHKAWQSLKAAREQVYEIESGTVVEWLNLETDRPGVQMLHYVFWAFRPCIEGFRSCRNVISVDGTHLYTKYKHKLLVAVTLDANQQVLPLAFALVDEESLASWRWFLQMLAKHLLPNDDDRDLCWRAGAEVNARKFERIMTEIRELNEEAYNWLGMIDKTQWTLSHDSGWRTGFAYVKLKPCSCASGEHMEFLVHMPFKKTYQGRFEPLYGEEYWDPVDIELVHNPAVRVRRGPGRYVSTRIPNEMDRPQARARQQYQSRQV
ncbi:UNVERIFIED_CONTAM: hypothetical protein Sangu_0590100 [Sesamum angustifolium]|uniref:MULE transposase domain-containing protein n=1 Tax=Sesamum angustifolium TaxID=2727405 RepID=A0AAW2QAN9_9LAMI